MDEEYTFTFSRAQHTTLIAALSLAASMYAHPEIVVQTLAAINPAAAQSLRESLTKRDAELGYCEHGTLTAYCTANHAREVTQ